MPTPPAGHTRRRCWAATSSSRIGRQSSADFSRATPLGPRRSEWCRCTRSRAATHAAPICSRERSTAPNAVLRPLSSSSGWHPGGALRPRRVSKIANKGDGDVMAGISRAALDVLSDPGIPGSEKRSALSPIVERVICRKGGAEIVFAPDLFDEPRDKDNDLWSKDGIMSGETGPRQTYHTTCMGMRTQR